VVGFSAGTEVGDEVELDVELVRLQAIVATNTAIKTITKIEIPLFLNMPASF
jgi:hypothetical protein